MLRCIPPSLPPLTTFNVQCILSLVTVARYVANVVNSEEVRDGECDSDGELVSMETCVFAVFEFISGLVDSASLQDLLPPILPTLVLHLISHMQLTHTQVHTHTHHLPHI